MSYKTRGKVRIEFSPWEIDTLYLLVFRDVTEKACTEKMDVRLIWLLFKFARYSTVPKVPAKPA